MLKISLYLLCNGALRFVAVETSQIPPHALSDLHLSCVLKNLFLRFPLSVDSFFYLVADSGLDRFVVTLGCAKREVGDLSLLEHPACAMGIFSAFCCMQSISSYQEGGLSRRRAGENLSPPSYL